MPELKYESQRRAYPFFVTMLVLFVIQVSYGLLIATQHVDPFLLRGIANFNVNRSAHLNLAIMWVLVGFTGSVLYLAPLIAGRDLRWPWMSRVLLVGFWVTAVWTIPSLYFAQRGVAWWFMGQPWLQQGLEYVSAGRITGVLVLAALMLLAVITLRVLPARAEWHELHWGLAIGVVGLVFFWLFGLFFVPTLDLQEYFRWFVVHYWVEGIWEVLYSVIVGAVLYYFFDADLKTVGLAVFWGVVLVAIAGLIGNGHHYFWVGTPALWQFWGGLFSGLEPLPIFIAVWHMSMNPVVPRARPTNPVAFYFVFGSALLYLIGAGILGFSQTFAITNVWEHGTWVTAAHAHLALFGTFGMLLLGMAYAAIPAIKGLGRHDDRMSMVGFWVIFCGILGMVLSFALGGTVQVFVYRVLGLDWFRFEVDPALQLWRILLLVAGLTFATGVFIVAYDLFTLKPGSTLLRQSAAEDRRPPTGWWRRPVALPEFIGWVSAIVLVGLLPLAALLSNNLEVTRLGSPVAPFVLAGIGYPGLAVLALAFTIRAVRAHQAGQQPISGTDTGAYAGQ